MGLKVQICPIGFEYKRVLAGLQYHPPNLIYLLYSQIEKTDYRDDDRKYRLDEKLVTLSQEFTDKLENYFKSQIYLEVKTYECSFTKYKKLMAKLCDVIHEIFQREIKGEVIDEIWFNIGTATKLFVSAAQYIASFRVDKIHLFYVSAHNYTINELLLEDLSKEDIEKLFREEGISFSSRALLDDYSLENVPVVSSQQTTEQANAILKVLLEQINENFESKWVSFTNILNKLEQGLEKRSREEIKSLKMKYHHHVKQLKDRRLIEEESHGRQKRYKLTEEGIIFAMIITSIPLNNHFKERS